MIFYGLVAVTLTVPPVISVAMRTMAVVILPGVMPQAAAISVVGMAMNAPAVIHLGSIMILTATVPSILISAVIRFRIKVDEEQRKRFCKHRK